MSADRDRAIRYLKSAVNAATADEATDDLSMASRRLRFENDRVAQSVRRAIRYVGDAPLDELQDLAQRERRRLERGW